MPFVPEVIDASEAIFVRLILIEESQFFRIFARLIYPMAETASSVMYLLKTVSICMFRTNYLENKSAVNISL